MTEDPDIKDEYLVQVKAQVMTRDDSTGGWVPMGGGGMSIVGLRKLVISTGAEDLRKEYLIHGQRIADQSVVLNCILKKDVHYTKATPTFHHWTTEEKRFGLTFQSSAEARAFDKGVKRAIEDLLDGSPESNDLEMGEDEVFMALDLPLGRKGSSSQSASTASTTTSSPSPQSPAFCVSDQFHVANHHHHHHHLHRMHYITRHQVATLHHQHQSPPASSTNTSTRSARSNESTGQHVGYTSSHSGSHEDVWVKAEIKNGMGSDRIKSDQGSSTAEDNIEIKDNYSYVQFAKDRPIVHDYSYPTLDSLSKSPQRRDSITSQKKHNQETISTGQPPLPTKLKKKRKRSKRDKKHLLSQRVRCVYCNEMFAFEENQRGNCEDAPDRVAECIEQVSCICCARGMLYHCMADADGDYGHPCICDTSDVTNCRKWTALTILSLFVPCLWCYWPLTACHRCGVACGCCGGRHKAA